MDCLRASDGPADQHSLDLTPPASKSSGWLRITRPQRSTVGRAWSPAAVVPDQPNVVAARRDRPDTAGYGRAVRDPRCWLLRPGLRLRVHLPLVAHSFRPRSCSGYRPLLSIAIGVPRRAPCHRRLRWMMTIAAT